MRRAGRGSRNAAAIDGPRVLSLGAALSFGGYVVTLAASSINFVLHEPPQRWFFIFVFMMSGTIYIGWQLMLVVISLGKIFLKADGGWEITERLAEPGVAPRAGEEAKSSSPRAPSAAPLSDATRELL